MARAKKHGRCLMENRRWYFAAPSPAFGTLSLEYGEGMFPFSIFKGEGGGGMRVVISLQQPFGTAFPHGRHYAHGLWRHRDRD
jgi:hypothetical protein